MVLPDGELREDWIGAGDLLRYRTVVLPACTFLTPAQVDAVRGYLERGGRVIAAGEIGTNLDAADRASLLGHPGLVRTTEVDAGDVAGGPQVVVEPAALDFGINIHRVGDREAAIHIIRYDDDEGRDEVPVLDRLRLDVRLSRPFRTASAVSPSGEVGCRLECSRERREMHRIELERVPLYTVISLR